MKRKPIHSKPFSFLLQYCHTQVKVAKSILLHINTSFLILLLALSAVFFSCDDKDDGTGIVQTLHAMEVSQISRIRLFIGGVEQFDQEMIKKYTENSYFDIPMEKVSGKIVFYGSNTAMFNQTNIKFSVEKKDDLFLFISPGYFTSHNNWDKYNRTYQIIKHKTPHEHAYEGYKTNEVRVARGDYHRLELSYLIYKHSINQDYYKAYYSGTLFNEFSKDVSFLSEKDTLAIRECKILFKDSKNIFPAN